MNWQHVYFFLYDPIHFVSVRNGRKWSSNDAFMMNRENSRWIYRWNTSQLFFFFFPFHFLSINTISAVDGHLDMCYHTVLSPLVPHFTKHECVVTFCAVYVSRDTRVVKTAGNLWVLWRASCPRVLEQVAEVFKYQLETEGKNPDFCLNSFLHCKPAQTKVIRLSSLNCLEARVECKLSTLTQIT